jgi:hypothetical protein
VCPWRKCRAAAAPRRVAGDKISRSEKLLRLAVVQEADSKVRATGSGIDLIRRRKTC